MIGMSIKRISVLNLCHVLKPFVKSTPGVRFTKVFRTELGHKYILVECSVIALCLPVVSKLSNINSCAINRTMIGMSIKRISVLNLCHVLKPFVKSTPGHYKLILRLYR